MARSTKVTDYLKDCIADALLSLIAVKTIDKITIDEITEKAGVGRASYFRYFNNKQQALEHRLIKLWFKWTDEHNVVEAYRYTTDNIRTFFEFNDSIKSTLELLYRSDLQSVVHNAFFSIMAQNTNENTLEYYESGFYSNGLFGLLNNWIKNNFKESVDEMEGICRLFLIPKLT